jgi:hypothetical protein
MLKWEYLQINVELARNKLVVSADGEAVVDMQGSGVEKELAHYLNSLGAEGWELVNADKNEYGFRNYFFKRPVGDSSQ